MKHFLFALIVLALLQFHWVNASMRAGSSNNAKHERSASEGHRRLIDENIKHIVIFMQENRAFDHYYGSLAGVRGFNDRAATPTRLGADTFFQPIVPDAVHTNVTNHTLKGPFMLPFPVRSTKTNAMCMPAPSMDFYVNMGIIDEGRFDHWNTARDPGLGMGYFDRTDLPYYYSLSDHFLVGDHYFQSTFTETNPNRLHLFSGSNGLSVESPPVLFDEEPFPGWKWETLAETLQEANVSWRVYQELDNFDDNAFAWFYKFQTAKNGSVWYDQGMYRSWSILTELEEDMKNGKLPQVSWVIAPAYQSEHASNHPAAGEALSSQILEIVKKYPEVYKNMAFILNYDEGGQFYDHLWTPTPPMNQPVDGQSTVSTKGEFFQCQDFPFLISEKECPADFNGINVVNGLGYRVPLLVISPWTRGPLVSSEVFDHTSVVRLIETRFNVTCPNISPWRRAVAGNLADVFNFDSPDYSWPEKMPKTSLFPIEADLECLLLPPPEIPAEQSFPPQEKGTRISRALPYNEFVSTSFDSKKKLVNLTLTSTGTSSGSYIWYNVHDIGIVIPKKFLVEPGKTIFSNFNVSSTGNYSLALHGVNGFVRQVSGTQFPDPKERVQWLQFQYNSSCGIELSLLPTTTTKENDEGEEAFYYRITDNAYQLGGPWYTTLSEQSGEKRSTLFTFNISSSGRWYDFTVDRMKKKDRGEGSNSIWSQRFMGRMENGKDSISDPAMSAGVRSHLYGPKELRYLVGDKGRLQYPRLPDDVRLLKKITEGKSKDSKFYHPDEL